MAFEQRPMYIAVTGVGCVTPCGNNVDASWEALVAGQSGVDRITRFPTEGLPVGIAAEVQGFDASVSGLERKDARRLASYVLYALVAAREALDQAGVLNAEFDPRRVGSIVGSGVGCLRPIELEVDVLRKKGPRRVNPLLVPSGTPEVAPSEICRQYGFKGPSFAVCTACSSGSDAIIAGARCLMARELDVVVVGGTEDCISELSLATFGNLGALASEREDPKTSSRPFDRDRSGFVMGQGAGILVLETLEHAEQRGAEVLALLSGYGQTTDAYHKTAPDPSGEEAAHAMQMALGMAGVSAEEIGYINAHGTGTLQNDPVETLVIRKALGKLAERIPISSTKSMTGHMIGAAGAVEAIIAILAMRSGRIPPTINLDNPDPACDLFYVPNAAIEASVETSVSNSFGFGGHNSCLVFQSPQSLHR